MATTMKLEIRSSGAALTESKDSARAEVARLLRETADDIESGYWIVAAHLFDINGQRAGCWDLDIEVIQ